MTPRDLLPTLDAAAAILPELDWSPAARVQLLATAMQESGGLRFRIQVPSGAARSFFQMERREAVLEVLTNTRSLPLLTRACETLVIPMGLDSLFEAVAWNDTLATCMARLNYWLSPLPIPVMGDKAAALTMYGQTWKPAWFLNNKPEPGRWDASYAAAAAAIRPTET